MAIQRTILITGASSGLGRALSILYAKSGIRLLLTGRDRARLKRVAEECQAKGAVVEVTAIPVTDHARFSAQVVAWDETEPIDLVIANAGISGGGGSQGLENEEQFRAIIDTNLQGVLNTVNPLLPRMQARKKGQVALVSSLAGYRGLPGAPAYSVSKNAVRAYAEALRPLLIQDHVDVRLICPGFIRTPLTARNPFTMPFILSAEEAAFRIQAGLTSSRPVIAFPWPMVVLTEFLRILPRRWGDALLTYSPRKT